MAPVVQLCEANGVNAIPIAVAGAGADGAKSWCGGSSSSESRHARSNWPTSMAAWSKHIRRIEARSAPPLRIGGPKMAQSSHHQPGEQA